MAGSIVAQSKTHHPGNSKLEDEHVSGSVLKASGMKFYNGIYIQTEQVTKMIFWVFPSHKEQIVAIWEPVNGRYKEANPSDTMYHRKGSTSE